MSGFKGTPGPWFWEGKVLGNSENIVGGDGWNFKDSDKRLIAAAPDLLEALQNLKREVVLSDIDLAYIESHFRPHIDRARAAIAKALGQ